MNLTNMRTLLREHIGNAPESEVDNNKLNTLLSLANTDISDRYRFHKARKICRFDTVAGQDNYDLPTAMTALLRAQDVTNFRKLTKVGDRQYSSRTSDSQGKPEKYVRYRGYIQLIPIPDGVYTIEIFYRYAAIDLTTEDQSPEIPSVWHYGIVLYAKYLYRSAQGDVPKRDAAMEEFKLWVSDKPTEIDEESVDIDSGVEIPTLTDGSTRLDFDNSE
jgi:hypothetical protein